MFLLLTALITIQGQSEHKISLMIQDFSDTSNQQIFIVNKGRNSALVHALMEQLTTRLSFFFQIVEREKLDTIMAEQNRAKSGAITKNQAVTDLNGATYLLTGAIINFSHQPQRVMAYGAALESHTYQMDVIFKIIDTSTGDVLFPGQSRITEKTRFELTPDHMARELSAKAAEEVAESIEGFFKDESDRGEAGLTAKKNQKITLTSKPNGAEVDFDGLYEGKTPFTLEVTPGIHEVTFTYPGYHTWKKKIRIQKDMEINPELAIKEPQQ